MSIQHKIAELEARLAALEARSPPAETAAAESAAARELAYVARALDEAKIPTNTEQGIAYLPRDRVQAVVVQRDRAVHELAALAAHRLEAVAVASNLRAELATASQALVTLQALVSSAAGILVESREQLKLRGHLGDRAIQWIKEWSTLGGGS